MDHSDLDRQIELLRRCETIKESEVKALCSKAREILVEESNVQRVDSPVTVRRKCDCERKMSHLLCKVGLRRRCVTRASRKEQSRVVDYN